MSWITLNESNVLTTLTSAEVNALKTAALAGGQSDPLLDTIAKVIQEVRGYVAANQINRLGAGATIPQELEADALAIIRYRAFNRLPIGKGLLTQTRIDEYKEAQGKLRDVAAGRFRIEQPADISPQVIAGPAVQLASSSPREATRKNMRGI